MEGLLIILVIGGFWALFSTMSNPIEDTTNRSKSDTKTNDDHDAAFERTVNEFEQKYLVSRVRYLGELNAEIAKYSGSNAVSADPESGQLPKQLETRLKKYAQDMWCKHEKEQDETKASLIKQARINEFKSSEQALLDERSKLLLDIDSLSEQKEEIVSEAKTYIAMMEKLNGR